MVSYVRVSETQHTSQWKHLMSACLRLSTHMSQRTHFNASTFLILSTQHTYIGGNGTVRDCMSETQHTHPGTNILIYESLFKTQWVCLVCLFEPIRVGPKYVIYPKGGHFLTLVQMELRSKFNCSPAAWERLGHTQARKPRTPSELFLGCVRVCFL